MKAPQDLVRALEDMVDYVDQVTYDLNPWQRDDLANAKLMLEKYQTWYCVYCAKEVPGPGSACCKEVGHTTTKEFPL